MPTDIQIPPLQTLSNTDKFRHFLDTSDKIERLAAKIPGVNEPVVVARMIKLFGYYGADICDGKELRVIKREMCERGADIMLGFIPTGSLPLQAAGLYNPAKEALTRVLMAHNEISSFNLKGAWGALTTGQIPEYEKGSIGYKANQSIQKFHNYFTTGQMPAREADSIGDKVDQPTRKWHENFLPAPANIQPAFA